MPIRNSATVKVWLTMPDSPDQLGLTLIKFDAYKNPENFEKGIRRYLTIILAKVAHDN